LKLIFSIIELRPDPDLAPILDYFGMILGNFWDDFGECIFRHRKMSQAKFRAFSKQFYNELSDLYIFITLVIK